MSSKQRKRVRVGVVSDPVEEGAWGSKLEASETDRVNGQEQTETRIGAHQRRIRETADDETDHGS